MSKRIHLYSFILVAATFVAGILVSRAVFSGDPNIKVEVSSPSYLNYWDRARTYGGQLIKAEGLLRVAVETRKKEDDIYQRYQRLGEKGAISREELSETRLRYEVSVERVKHAESEVENLKAKRAQQLSQALYAKGDPVKLDELYSHFLNAWQADCRTFKAGVALAEAEVRYRDILVKNAEKLLPQQAMSYDEFLTRTTDYRNSLTELEVQKELEAVCLLDVPTLEFLKGIQPQKSSL